MLYGLSLSRTGELSRYFAPLALQAASQSLTYPLVAMVASRGPGGPLNLAGLAQSNTVMFLLGIFGIGLLTTGMVYGTTREGYRQFRSVTLILGFLVVVVQALCCIPDAAHLIFGQIIGLPPSIELPARITLLASIPVQYLFFLRIPYQVAMYNGRATGKASLATIARIVITALLSPLFCAVGLVGPIWAIVCLTLPVAFETVISRILARPFLQELKPSRGKAPGRKEIFLFNLPLSIGNYFLSISAIILGAFIARAPEPEQMLPVYYLALGLATPVAYAATRIQAVILAFPPESPEDRTTLGFSMIAGACLGLFPLLFLLPGLADLYYVNLQKLPLGDLSLVRITAVLLIPFPFSVAMRAYQEGLAAWYKKPGAVLGGQAAFMGTVVVTAFLSLALGLPGYVIGCVGLTLGSFASSGTMSLCLYWETEKEVPVPPTTTSQGQIR
jgi:hypothetical protein